MPAAHQGFLQYRRYRYLKAGLWLSAASLAAYLWHDPPAGPSGDTGLGYALGTLSALMIIWLAWLGVRKRSYAHARGSLKGWLSAHVYLGLALIMVATLHTGLRFGWNIHTASYALMLLVIASGLYGVFAYVRYPTLITRNHAEATLDTWLAEIQDLNEQALRLADILGGDVHQRVVRSNDRISIGGSGWAQLRGRPRARSQASTQDLTALTTTLQQRIKQAAARSGGQPEDDFAASSLSTVMFMADQLVAIDQGPQEAEQLRKLLDVIARRNELVARANLDIAMTARMQVWLYLHVPLTFALLAALAAHIISVFLYW